MTIDLSEALERLHSAENDNDIARIFEQLSDPAYRSLDQGAEAEYGSDIEDLLQEPDMDRQEWISLINKAISTDKHFKESR